MLASTLAVFALHPTAHGSWDASLLAQRIALGKQLFNDPSLSADGSVRCASCHMLEKSYTDGRAVAIGVYGRTGTRNTSSLLNIAAANEPSFFWDERRTALEQAVPDPLTNPVEMGLHDPSDLMRTIAKNPAYRTAFAQASPDDDDHLTPNEVGTALAAYVHSLMPPDSAFDHYLRGDRTTLNTRAQLGLALFRGLA